VLATNQSTIPVIQHLHLLNNKISALHHDSAESGLVVKNRRLAVPNQKASPTQHLGPFEHSSAMKAFWNFVI